MLTEQAAEKGLPHVAGDVVSTAVADHWAWTRFIGNESCVLFNRTQTPDDAGSWGQFALSRIPGLEAWID